MKNLDLALKQYQQDAEQHFPQRVVRNTGREEGWAWRLGPYIKDTAIFNCSLEETQNDFDFGSPSHTDYYFNSRLSNLPDSNLKFPAQTILLGEGEAASNDYACTDFSRCIGQNAEGAVGVVTQEAKLRHLKGANYAFADGHVKWIKPHRIQQRKIAGRMYGFPVN
ncbi:MAG TPA: H-X9-DG-CTERM domain-containing protein [Abditibacteriaceae bacterium]